MYWKTARYRLDLTRPVVMGIVNVTPDSFSDGGALAAPVEACRHCDRLLAEGADILDIGGESTRPGAVAPSLDEERARVLPVVRHAVGLGVPVSVDTSRPEVMADALAIGADILNDVRAFRRPGALAVLVAHPGAGACLMHMRGEPATMVEFADYDDVVDDVVQMLRQRVAEVVACGVTHDRIVVDPGIGFAKTASHNWSLMQRLNELQAIGRPVLLGASRKSLLGALTGRPVGDRLAASLAAALAGVQRGARILRVHDVAATVDALKVWQASGLVPEPVEQ